MIFLRISVEYAILYTTLSGVGIDLGGMGATRKMLYRSVEHFCYQYGGILLWLSVIKSFGSYLLTKT